jgi:hypothetical protein
MYKEDLLKIAINPLSSRIETFEEIVIKSHVPYSKSGIHIMIQPSVIDYKEHDGDANIEVAQLMVVSNTEDTKILEFNLLDKKEHKIEIGEFIYTILLQNIGEEQFKELGNQKFLYYEFFARKEPKTA